MFHILVYVPNKNKLLQNDRKIHDKSFKVCHTSIQMLLVKAFYSTNVILLTTIGFIVRLL